MQVRRIYLDFFYLYRRRSFFSRLKNEGKFNLDDKNRCIYFWENKILDSTKSNLMGCIGCHSSEIRGLCLMKKPCKALQHFPYFIKKFHFLEENFLKERKKRIASLPFFSTVQLLLNGLLHLISFKLVIFLLRTSVQSNIAA